MSLKKCFPLSHVFPIPKTAATKELGNFPLNLYLLYSQK